MSSVDRLRIDLVISPLSAHSAYRTHPDHLLHVAAVRPDSDKALNYCAASLVRSYQAPNEQHGDENVMH